MIKRRPYLLLLFVSSILFFLGFILNEETIDVNVHDTYYVILRKHLYWLLSVELFFFSLFYLMFYNAKINFGNLFSKVHVFGTLISVTGLLFPYSLIFRTTEFPLYDNLLYINLCMTISFLLFLILQIIFIINIFVTLTKRLIKKKAL